jgi:hypothetical protein
MSTKLMRTATALAVATGLAWGTTAPAHGESPVLFRFHAVHNTFSGDNEICGIAADWTYTENATILVMTAKDIPDPENFAYGKVLGPVTETYTTAHGSVTVQRRLALSDVRGSFTQVASVTTWRTRFSGTIKLIDNLTGRTLTSGAGQVVFQEAYDAQTGTVDETVVSADGSLRGYFDNSCSVITAVLG